MKRLSEVLQDSYKHREGKLLGKSADRRQTINTGRSLTIKSPALGGFFRDGS